MRASVTAERAGCGTDPAPALPRLDARRAPRRDPGRTAPQAAFGHGLAAFGIGPASAAVQRCEWCGCQDIPAPARAPEAGVDPDPANSWDAIMGTQTGHGHEPPEAGAGQAAGSPAFAGARGTATGEATPRNNSAPPDPARWDWRLGALHGSVEAQLSGRRTGLGGLAADWGLNGSIGLGGRPSDPVSVDWQARLANGRARIGTWDEGPGDRRSGVAVGGTGQSYRTNRTYGHPDGTNVTVNDELNLGSMGAELSVGEHGTTIGQQMTVAEAGVNWATHGTSNDANVRLAAGLGEGFGARAQYGTDPDQDQSPTYGVGADVGPGSFDFGLEEPDRAETTGQPTRAEPAATPVSPDDPYGVEELLANEPPAPSSSAERSLPTSNPWDTETLTRP